MIICCSTCDHSIAAKILQCCTLAQLDAYAQYFRQISKFPKKTIRTSTLFKTSQEVMQAGACGYHEHVVLSIFSDRWTRNQLLTFLEIVAGDCPVRLLPDNLTLALVPTPSA